METKKINKKAGCICLRDLVEKWGWVKYKKRYTQKGKNIGNNQKFFIVETNTPRKKSPGNIGIVLNNCFICGRKIPGRDIIDAVES